jgi:hypothetical protein
VQTTTSIVSAANPAAERSARKGRSWWSNSGISGRGLAIADADVDDNAKRFGFDNEGVEAHQTVAVGIDVVGRQPSLRGNVRRFRLGEEVDPKGMTCSTTRVIRTSPTSHEISWKLLAT